MLEASMKDFIPVNNAFPASELPNSPGLQTGRWRENLVHEPSVAHTIKSFITTLVNPFITGLIHSKGRCTTTSARGWYLTPGHWTLLLLVHNGGELVTHNASPIRLC